MGKDILLTGLQPSGGLHIGNYFGALKPFVDVYEDYQSFLMIADYHALTTLRDPEALRQNTLDITIAYLAAGVDPEKAVIFQQSRIPEHMEMAWVFECVVTVPFLMQAHAYKDKVAKGLEANAGLFNYPMLMAADILLYDADFVPVGEDQRQHIEYAREAANKFNLAYEETFKAPQEKILESVGVVPGTDGQKMSKSYKNTIPLFGNKDDTTKAVMGIVTDSGEGIPENVYNIHKLFKSEDELETLYKEHAGKYKNLKEALLEDILAYLEPIQAKEKELRNDIPYVENILKEGSENARDIAQTKIQDVRNKIGIYT